MAELSGFWTTTGTATGDQQASYTQAQWSTALRIVSACSGFEGVAPGYLNELAGTVTGANTVAINTGGGMCDGKWFINDASQNVNVPSAVGGGNTRIDRIVLRADWANFNVSVYRIAGTDAASPTAPAITQTSGTTYDIQLYQALVDTAGTVTLTNERTWATTNAVRRVGGSATIWATAGTTNYATGKTKIQAGVATIALGAADTYKSVAVTFPVAFSYAPVVYITSAQTNSYSEIWGLIMYGGSARTFTGLWASSVSTTGFTANVDISTAFGAGINLTVHWLAIGPE